MMTKKQQHKPDKQQKKKNKKIKNTLILCK